MHAQAVFLASGRTYGSRRLSAALRAQGHDVGRHRCRTLMKACGLKACWRRKFAHTTDSKHHLPVAENVLNRQFEPEAPIRLGVRCDVHSDRQRLAISGRCAGSVFTSHRGLVHGTDHACTAGVRCVEHGYFGSPTGTGFIGSFGPGQSICQC